MKINFPRVYAPVNLTDYAPGFEGVIRVWCNPPRQLILDTVKAVQDDGAIDDYIAQLWQDFSPADVAELREQANDTDPAFLPWLLTRTFESINAHREGVKKNHD